MSFIGRFLTPIVLLNVYMHDIYNYDIKKNHTVFDFAKRMLINEDVPKETKLINDAIIPKIKSTPVLMKPSLDEFMESGCT